MVTKDGDTIDTDIDGSLTLDVEAGYIQGKGSDYPGGDFTITGFISSNLQVSFIKRYEDSDQI
jgi:hypothetical protein